MSHNPIKDIARVVSDRVSEAYGSLDETPDEYKNRIVLEVMDENGLDSNNLDQWNYLMGIANSTYSAMHDNDHREEI